ncbi:MAG: hypothetical protein JWL77_1294 [Chthonomonadaceae bacterium]|nr:hypothetical protein [Chthonomonadaceae bacterium]
MSNEPPGCLFALFRLFGIGGLEKTRTVSEISTTGLTTAEIPATLQETELPVRLGDRFLSAAEISFYHVLKNAMGEQYVICPKVRLSDIFSVVRLQENLGVFNKISLKHVDFLLCDPQSLQPLLGVELDDSSHLTTKSIARDELVEKVFATAGLPLARIPVRAGYTISDLQAAVQNVLTPKSSGRTAVPLDQAFALADSETPASTSGPPACPKCSIPMVLRTAQRGERQGRQFYGCSNYPRCREVINLDGAQMD